MRVEFHGLHFDLPAGWADITDDLPIGSPPTLACETGVGVIQFSSAVYSSGVDPEVTIDSLWVLITDFCDRKSLIIGEIEELLGQIMIVGFSSSVNEELVAAWYLSDGKNVILVTYTSSDACNAETNRELAQARDLITTINFRRQQPPFR
jgi:hypothetical protein